MELPADTHVHSEFSWDTGGPTSPTAAGTMERTCARAVRIGLSALIFTDHLDLSGWVAAPDDFDEHHRPLINADGVMQPPPVDFDGYFASIERCRHLFPDLRILTGVEFGQPHLDWDAAGTLVDLSALDRVNGSLHTLPFRGHRSEPTTMFREVSDPAEVIWAYLAEVSAMVDSDSSFPVFTHIDYAVRYWPTGSHGPFDPRRFEEGFRHAMRAIAASGRALEMNTGHLRAWIPQWWSEEGGRAVSFGSDDHATSRLAVNFPEATALAEDFGFRPGRRAEDLWTR